MMSLMRKLTTRRRNRRKSRMTRNKNMHPSTSDLRFKAPNMQHSNEVQVPL
jgi:hypothetical protein